MAAVVAPSSSRPDRGEVSAHRRFTRPSIRNKGPWYGRTVVRLNFERGVKSQFSNLRGRKVKGGYEYRATVPVPCYKPRKVCVQFKDMVDVPCVFADGPRESPHRYCDNSLCMWYPEDPVERRWVFADGLLTLMGLVMAHLFKEAWWRETGEWLGEEVSHGAQSKEQVGA